MSLLLESIKALGWMQMNPYRLLLFLKELIMICSHILIREQSGELKSMIQKFQSKSSLLQDLKIIRSAAMVPSGAMVVILILLSWLDETCGRQPACTIYYTGFGGYLWQKLGIILIYWDYGEAKAKRNIWN